MSQTAEPLVLDGAAAVIATPGPEATQSKENMGHPETPRSPGQDLEVLAMTVWTASP
jgi:hypothetical protein